MRNAELLAVMNRICHHQVAQDAHPLTCGIDSRHPPLFPLLLGGRIILRCAACGYRQSHIPEMFLSDNGAITTKGPPGPRE